MVAHEDASRWGGCVGCSCRSGSCRGQVGLEGKGSCLSVWILIVLLGCRFEWLWSSGCVVLVVAWLVEVAVVVMVGMWLGQVKVS